MESIIYVDIAALEDMEDGIKYGHLVQLKMLPRLGLHMIVSNVTLLTYLCLLLKIAYYRYFKWTMEK